MIRKPIAIAALALLATSGLASARTTHSSKTVQPAAISSFDNALNQYGNGAQNQAFNHPGDNDMDRYGLNYK